MKKYLFLLPMLFILSGCGIETGIIKCTLSSNDVVNGYSVEAEYNVKYEGKNVDSVETIETVTSDSEDILANFEETLNNTYTSMQEAYGGYDYKITNENGKVISKVTIDYSKIDIDKLVKDQPTLKSYVENGKLNVDGIKAIYESTGVTCN